MIYMKSIRPIPSEVTEHMYDGNVVFTNGVAEIPDTRQGHNWRDRLLGLGYAECSKADFNEARGIVETKQVDKDAVSTPPFKKARSSV